MLEETINKLKADIEALKAAKAALVAAHDTMLKRYKQREVA